MEPSQELLNQSDTEDYLQLMLNQFYDSYYIAYAYVATVVGVVGIITNCLIIVVLTRPKMFSTTNVLLTAIASTDLVVLSTYVVYICKWRLFEHDCNLGRPTSYSWALFEVIFANVTLTLRAFSLWLTVAMAALRNQIISSKQPHTHLNSDKNIAIQLILLCGVIVIIMAMPIYFSLNIGEEMLNNLNVNDSNATICHLDVGYFADSTAIVTVDSILLHKISYWTNGVSFRLLPCVLLTCYIPALLLKSQHICGQLQLAAIRRRRSLLNYRTTMILITILITTWLTETPHGAMSIICGICPKYIDLYQALGDIFDLLTLLNCTFTFFLYSTMSKRFRNTLNLTVRRFMYRLGVP